ncbi:MAG TPA: DUF3027 domain-containing protein [Streptosporangiaceae bacterium]|nr:DUF3027 domain-containing protein [Streptosporangiaceae bacterium]
MSPVRVRSKEPDQACEDAVDLARAALVEAAGADQVGQHLGLEAGGDRVVTHLFECLDPAYPGWRWVVTVTRASRAKTVTVDDSALLPGPGALLAPAWVPWRDRLQPGDLGVGDLLPAHEDDERLVPMVMLAGDNAVLDWYADGPAEAPDPVDARQAPTPVFPGRARVLSLAGRDETAERWYDGEHGPHSPIARAAPATCASCGFFVPLSGVLGQVFGGCANEFAPDDGRVVSGDHGCGAHSESTLTETQAQAIPPVIDEFGYDLVDMPGVSLDETVFESFSGES